MKIFVAGVTGATGQLLTSQLLASGHTVFGFARNPGILPSSILRHGKVNIQQGGLLDIPDEQLKVVLDQVDGIASCLGHNITWQGLWGHPRMLVRDALRRLVELSKHKPMRLVLMSSNGVANKGSNERFQWLDRTVISVLRTLLPPHKDNELAAEFLQKQTYPHLEWSIVRPDNLVNHAAVTDYQAFTSPQLGVISGSGQTSRINVANFISRLLTDETTWATWQGQWPVLYNEDRLNEKLAAI